MANLTILVQQLYYIRIFMEFLSADCPVNTCMFKVKIETLEKGVK